MREPYGGAVAKRHWPRAMRTCPQGYGRSVSRGTCRQDIEPRKWIHSGCRRCSHVRKALPGASLSRDASGPRAVLAPRHARKLSGRELGDPTSGLAEWRRGPHRESQGSKAVMHGRGKSDRPIVPRKPVNKGRDASRSAERAEGRGLAKGKSCRQNRSRILSRARSQYGEPQTGTQRETAETAKGRNLR